MYKFLAKILTHKYTKIPLLYVTFNYNAYLKQGSKNSCLVKAHPLIGNDERVIHMLNDLIDYIREEYDMSQML